MTTSGIAHQLYDNGDFVLDDRTTAVYLGMDVIGGIRQVGQLVEVGARLAGAGSVALAASLVTPVGFLVTGPTAIFMATHKVIPDAEKNLVEAEKYAQGSLSGDLREDAEVGVELAEQGLSNSRCFLYMGVAQTACAGTQLLSATPVLAGTAAAPVAALGLGAVYAKRGWGIYKRAAKSYQIVDQFETNMKSKTKEQIEAFIGQLTPEYLKRRTGLDKPHVEELPKAVFTEKLKHKVSKIVGTSMGIGGMITVAIAIALLVAGLLYGMAYIAIPLAVLSAVAALFFLAMETVFFTYDSAKLFLKYRDAKWEVERNVSSWHILGNEKTVATAGVGAAAGN